MYKIIGLVFLVLLAAVVLSFTSLNAQSIQINYYFGTFDVPLAMAMVLSIAVGILFGFSASFGMFLRLKREIRRLRKSANASEKELISLRSAPSK
jgi:putative membrane protein